MIRLALDEVAQRGDEQRIATVLKTLIPPSGIPFLKPEDKSSINNENKSIWRCLTVDEKDGKLAWIITEDRIVKK